MYTFILYNFLAPLVNFSFSFQLLIVFLIRKRMVVLTWTSTELCMPCLQLSPVFRMQSMEIPLLLPSMLAKHTMNARRYELDKQKPLFIYGFYVRRPSAL